MLLPNSSLEHSLSWWLFWALGWVAAPLSSLYLFPVMVPPKYIRIDVWGRQKCLQSQPRSEWQWLATMVVLSSSEFSTVSFHSLLQRDRWSLFPHLSDVGFSYRLTLDNRVRTEEEKPRTMDSMTWLCPSLCHSPWSNTSLDHLSGSKKEVTHIQSKPNSPSHSWS